MAPTMALSLHLVARFCVEMAAIAVGGLINGLSTVSVDILYSTLKAVMRPLNTKHKRAAFQDKEN